MPPKKQKESKKTEQKKKDKVVQDKTFGLKNKKGAKQQKFVQQVQKQVQQAGDPRQKKAEQERLAEKKRKEEEKRKKAEIDKLFKQTIVQPKLPPGVDPKSVLCQFFKQGQCTKGDKCKYSHNLAVERKAAKRQVYETEADEELENDTMDKWDEQKLKDVIQKKHGAHNKKKNKTTIVCKHFKNALINQKYGWFWNCPNGDACIYKHTLPPGYVLEPNKKKATEAKDEISIEELIEKERAALGPNVTRVTLQSFMAWKKRKREEKLKEQKSKKAKRKNDFKEGKTGATGREVFEFQPDLVAGDDAEAGDDVDYTQRNEDDPASAGTSVKGVDTTMFVPKEVDTTLPVQKRQYGTKTGEALVPDTDDKIATDPAAAPAEGGGESSGSAKPETNGAAGENSQEAAAKTVTSPPPPGEELADVEDVDESLFAEDLDDELAELELS